MMDGLRPEAVTAEHCPNLLRVMARGASTLRDERHALHLLCVFTLHHTPTGYPTIFATSPTTRIMGM